MSGPDWAVDAVYDIECAEWDQFLCGALWTERDGVQVFRDPDGLADALLDLPKGTQVWGHAAGKYDALWYIDHLAHRGGKPPQAAVTMSGASATSIRFKDGAWLRDSNRLLPMSLAKAARIAGPGRAKGDPGLPCRCGEDCGGYCSLSKDMTRKQWRSVIDYQVDDVELLRDVLFGLRDFAEDHDIELRGTIGGSAWSTAKEWCGLPDADWSRDDYYATRDGYMGGRCEVGITEAAGTPCLWRYDRKSAYPAALMEPIPVGEYQRLTIKEVGKAWRKGLPGIYEAIVNVPEMAIPPLPHRHKQRLTYPWGQFAGSWSHVELRHAEECGVKIVKLISAVVWPREEAVLSPFAQKCFDLRDELPHSKLCTPHKCRDCLKASLGTELKFLANSATGKLGQSPESENVVLGDYADDDRYHLVGQSPWVWAKDAWRIPACGHVQWSATLTARARVELHKQQMHAGDHWAYSDTDSCFATKPLTRNVGKLGKEKLGEWAFEGRACTPPAIEWVKHFERAGWICLAPKVYAYYDMDKRKWIAHAKGVPDGEEMKRWRQYANGEQVTADRGVYGLKSAAAKGDRLFKRRTLTRTLRPNEEWCGARVRDGNVTRAAHVNELAALP